VRLTDTGVRLQITSVPNRGKYEVYSMVYMFTRDCNVLDMPTYQQCHSQMQKYHKQDRPQALAVECLKWREIAKK